MWFINNKLTVKKLSMLNTQTLYQTFTNKLSSLEQDDILEFNLNSLEKVEKFVQYCEDGYQYNTSHILALYDDKEHLLSLLGLTNIQQESGNLFQINFNNSTLPIKDIYEWFIDYAFTELLLKKLIVNTKYYNTKTLDLLVSLGMNDQFIIPYNRWIQNPIDETVLSYIKSKAYIDNTIIPFFKPIINSPFYSTIVEHIRHEIIICTNQSANSIGFNHWTEVAGISYRRYAEICSASLYFGSIYNHDTATAIHKYAKTIFKIQQYVFTTGHSASFIDSLPYNESFKSYLMVFTPIIHPNGQVIALQSTAIEYNLFNTQEHFAYLTQEKEITYSLKQALSNREKEVLFLLGNGLTQEQIAQILNLKRSTIASIIRNQLCDKFGIAGANSKVLAQIAIKNGHCKLIPKSLWRPSVTMLEDNLISWVNQRI